MPFEPEVVRVAVFQRIRRCIEIIVFREGIDIVSGEDSFREMGPPSESFPRKIVYRMIVKSMRLRGSIHINGRVRDESE